MRIGVSSNFAKKNGVAGGNDGVIKSLQKQIEGVQKQIAELSGDTTMDPKLKQEKKKILESEIQSLQQQIEQERKTEQEKKSEEVKNQLAQSNPIRSEDKKQIGFSDVDMQAIVSASTAMEQATSINHTRAQMIGEAGALKGAIAATKSRRGDTAELEGKLANLEVEINGVTNKIIAKYGEANESINDAFSKVRLDDNQEKNSEEPFIYDQKEESKSENKSTTKEIDVKA